MRTDERNMSSDELAQSMLCKEEEDDQRATKTMSMKRALMMFWRGLTALLVGMQTGLRYRCIKAIGYDMYLCKDNGEDGVILNGKGERIG